MYNPTKNDVKYYKLFRVRIFDKRKSQYPVVYVDATIQKIIRVLSFIK